MHPQIAYLPQAGEWCSNIGEQSEAEQGEAEQSEDKQGEVNDRTVSCIQSMTKGLYKLPEILNLMCSYHA